jgi:two-component system, NtrC family, response regulator AtoC
VSRSVLLIDDHPDVLQWLERLFDRAGWTTMTAQTGEAALDLLAAQRPDVILQDLQMPGLAGLDLLRSLRRTDPDAAVIIMTGHGDISTAVGAMQLGAESFLPKPLDVGKLMELADGARAKVELRRENRRQSTAPVRTGLESLGESPAMQAVARQVELVAATDATVLIQGETGTGKSWIARHIHELSPRATGPFVEVNCGSLSATFLDSELFGHEKGAFTDAKAQKRGLLEVAEGGTLFLDEIGDLAPELQPKLLTVLETRRFRRLGGTRQLVADIRLIAATHRPLEEDVREGRFREDLYYRISVLPLKLPPLRERAGADLVAVILEHLRLIRERIGRGPERISTDALTLLVRQPWSGNLRELRNVLERCLVTFPDAAEIRPEHLPPQMLDPVERRSEAKPDPSLPLEEVEKQHITRVLEDCGMNRSQAARVLGIGRRTLYDKLRRYGLE